MEADVLAAVFVGVEVVDEVVLEAVIGSRMLLRSSTPSEPS